MQLLVLSKPCCCLQGPSDETLCVIKLDNETKAHQKKKEKKKLTSIYLIQSVSSIKCIQFEIFYFPLSLTYTDRHIWIRMENANCWAPYKLKIDLEQKFQMICFT